MESSENTKNSLRQKMDAIFSDPTRHRFFSFSEANKTESWDGSLKVTTEKAAERFCIMCGRPRGEHADKEEVIEELSCEKNVV